MQLELMQLRERPLVAQEKDKGKSDSLISLLGTSNRMNLGYVNPLLFANRR